MNIKERWNKSLNTFINIRVQQGRSVTIGDLFMLREAFSSVELEKNYPEIQLDTVPIMEDVLETYIEESANAIDTVIVEEQKIFNVDVQCLEEAQNWDSDLEKESDKDNNIYHYIGQVIHISTGKKVAKFYLDDKRILVIPNSNIEKIRELTYLEEAIQTAFPDHFINVQLYFEKD